MASTRTFIRSRVHSAAGSPWASTARRSVAVLGVVFLVAACGANVPTARPSGSGGASPSGSALGASSNPSDSTLAPCKGTDLKAAIASWSGTAGSRLASILVSSKSGVTCTVRGTPGVHLVDGKGGLVLDSANVQGVGGPRVATADPVVVLGPGDELALAVQWTNWCHSQPVRPLTVALALTDRGGLLSAARAKKGGDDDAPSCTGKTKPSQVRVTHSWLGPGL